MAMDPQLAHVDHFLKKFGQSLKCSEEFYDEGHRLAHNVFLKLQEKSKHSVASVHYGGSFGKKTDVIEPDLDLVVVCNNIEPPLGEVLDEFEDVLTLYEEELRIVPKPGRSKYDMFKKSERSLNFCFYNGIDVDLLPAAVIEDKQEVIDKIKENPKNAYYYSPSLVKTQVKFLKRQDEKIASFVHTLIRLVKYWFKNLYFGEKVYGGSALIELICVAIAEKENNRDSSSMLRAFAEVLDTIAKLDSLKLAFHQVEEKDVDEDERKWETVPAAQLHLQNLSLIPEIIGDEKILRRKYFMVEPANPFQDILEDKTPTVIQNFKIFASQTRQLLSELMKCNLSENEFIQMLFQPRPPILVKLPALLLPNDLCIGCAYPCSFIVCGMQVRKEEVMKDDKKKHAIAVLKIRLLTVVNSLVTTNPETVTTTDVRNAVEGVTKTSLQVNLVTGTERHNEMDVTLTIPYRIKDQGYAVRFSMSWK